MTELQSLVERLEKAVGRLEAVSQAPSMHSSHGDGPPKGKRSCLANTSVCNEEIHVSFPLSSSVATHCLQLDGVKI